MKYIYQGKILDYGRDISSSVEVSTDYNEQQTKHVSLSAEQIAFFESNPTASVQEIWNCALTPAFVDNRTPAEKRQEQYEKRISPVLTQAFETYRAEYYHWLNLDLSKATEFLQKSHEKAAEIAAIKEQIRSEFPD